MKDFFSPYQEYFLPFVDKKIFIVGGTGFFGKWLAMAFHYANNTWNTNARVVSLSRRPDSFLQRNPEFIGLNTVEFRSGDASTFKSKESDFDFIIHAATDTNPILEKENPHEMNSTIIDGTKNIIQFAHQQKNVRMIFVSSGGVYGKLTTSIEESYPCTPFTSYGKLKLEAEHICNRQDNLSISIARCFTYAGAYLPLDAHFAVGNFILNAIKGQDIVIKGDGSPVRSYMYAGDLVLWLMKILVKGQDRRAYNVGSDYAVTIKELAQKVVEYSNQKIAVQVLGKKIHGAADYYLPNITRARTELGLKLETDFNHAIQYYYRWAQER